eukprot:UN09033
MLLYLLAWLKPISKQDYLTRLLLGNPCHELPKKNRCMAGASTWYKCKLCQLSDKLQNLNNSPWRET